MEEKNHYMMHLERRQFIERIRVIIERIGVIIERIGVIKNNPYVLNNPYALHLIYTCSPISAQFLDVAINCRLNQVLNV